MDVQMPGMDGFQTASLIKTRDRSRHIPIIFLTAISKDAAHVFEGYAHGAVDYMLKPYEPQILRSKVSVFVELWQRGELLKLREAKLRDLERDRLEQASAARYATLIETLPHCVLALRANGDPWFCNSVWRQYAGLDVDETRRRGFELLHPDDRAEARADWLQASQDRQPLQREVRLKRARDGEYRWNLIHILPQLTGEGGTLDGWIITAIDVHDEREARDELERVSRAKDEFLATVSHELRNPLNAILGWARMLRAGKLDAVRGARALDTIERNARMQASLVEDILDVSRIITGKLMLKVGHVDLATVVAAALDTVRMAAEAKQIEVVLELDDKLALTAGDPERLQQVVWNLLANAIKFTQPGGRVRVCMQRDGDDVELSVQDDGQGIAVEFLPFVFDRFRQADSTSTIDGKSTGWISIRSLPAMMRETSRMSSISSACARALRSIVSSARCSFSGDRDRDRSMCVHPTIALSGVRSSCDSVARNSSLARLAASAASRASRSLTARSACASCARLKFSMSVAVPIHPLTTPSGSRWGRKRTACQR